MLKIKQDIFLFTNLLFLLNYNSMLHRK